MTEGSLAFEVPIPAVFGDNADPREVRAHIAWFAPTRPGDLAYRAVKLKIPSLLATLCRWPVSGR